MDIRATILESIKTKMRLLQNEEQISKIERVGQILVQALNQGNKIIIAGNGGSAADAQHFAAELAGKFVSKSRPGLPAISLTTNTSILTAIGNDFGYDVIFSRQLEGLSRPEDVFFGISTSGNSKNILEAMSVARNSGLITVGLLGNDGGTIKNQSDVPIIVPSNNTQHIQEAHITIIHALCGIIDEAFSN